MNLGIAAALAAYTLWGLLPIYWKALQVVPTLDLVAHRTVWSFAFLLLWLAWRRRWAWIQLLRRDRRTQITFAATAGLLGLNWAVYLWAVNAGLLVDVSLGYFINPLINVMLGGLLLGERLRPGQGFAIVFAAAGVVYLTFNYGAFPWVALTVASTFALYGLLRKTASLDAVEGLFTEMAVLSVPALAFLLIQSQISTPVLGTIEAPLVVLLLLTGVVTALPLAWFSYGARRITLTTIGFLQYVAPTLQFLLGVIVFGESFAYARLVGFMLIWLSLAIYTLEGLMARRRLSPVRSAL